MGNWFSEEEKVEPFETRIQNYWFVRANTRSLASAEPTERTTPNSWLLFEDSPYVKEDTAFILRHFPSHDIQLLPRIMRQN